MFREFNIQMKPSCGFYENTHLVLNQEISQGFLLTIMEHTHYLHTFEPGRTEDAGWSRPVLRDVAMSATGSLLHGGELFSRRPGLGLGYAHPKLDERFDDLVSGEAIGDPREYKAEWAMPELDAAHEALEDHKEGGIIFLEGDLGGGKSTTLYDLRKRVREQRKSYVFIDGHFEPQPSRLDSALRWALRTGSPALIDSADYFFSKRLNRPSKNPEGFKEWEATIRFFVNSGGRLLATTHTSPWLDKNVKNPQSRELFNELLMDSTRIAIRGVITEDNLVPLIDRLFRNANDDRRMEAIEALAPLARAGGLNFRRMKVLIKSRPDWLENLSDQSLGELLVEIDRETRRKMGAKEDYVLK